MKTIPINEDLSILYKGDDITFVNFKRNKQLTVSNKDVIEFLNDLKDYPHNDLIAFNELLIVKFLNIIEGRNKQND